MHSLLLSEVVNHCNVSTVTSWGWTSSTMPLPCGRDDLSEGGPGARARPQATSYIEGGHGQPCSRIQRVSVVLGWDGHSHPRTRWRPDFAWLFPGEGGTRSPRTLDRAWDRARRAVGRVDLRFHDLRHTGLTWSAGLGATTAELMYRAGHKSPVAAHRYQHAAQDRDEVLADALGDLATGNIVHLHNGRTKFARTRSQHRKSGR